MRDGAGSRKAGPYVKCSARRLPTRGDIVVRSASYPAWRAWRSSGPIPWTKAAPFPPGYIDAGSRLPPASARMHSFCASILPNSGKACVRIDATRQRTGAYRAGVRGSVLRDRASRETAPLTRAFQQTGGSAPRPWVPDRYSRRVVSLSFSRVGHPTRTSQAPQSLLRRWRDGLEPRVPLQEKRRAEV